MVIHLPQFIFEFLLSLVFLTWSIGGQNCFLKAAKGQVIQKDKD